MCISVVCRVSPCLKEKRRICTFVVSYHCSALTIMRPYIICYQTERKLSPALKASAVIQRKRPSSISSLREEQHYLTCVYSSTAAEEEGCAEGFPPHCSETCLRAVLPQGKSLGEKNDTEGIQIGLVLRKKEEGDRKGTAFLFFYSVNDLKPIS